MSQKLLGGSSQSIGFFSFAILNENERVIAQNDRTSNAVKTHQQYFKVLCTFLEEMAINPHQNEILLRDCPILERRKL